MARSGSRRHPEDHTLYQRLLESTRDADGVVHKDHARKLLREILSEDADRLDEYADARATEVADGFDASHKPETANGQMALDLDTYIVIGDSERVRVDDCKSHHTRQWLDIQTINKARQDAAYAAKILRGHELLSVQEERKCSMWQAERYLRGDR